MICDILSGRILMLICGLCIRAFAAIETTDFVEDAYGNANLWELSETEKDGNGRKFAEGGESITSPVYAGAVVSARISAKTFSTGNGSSLKVEARRHGDGGWCELHNLVFSDNSATNEVITLSRADNYRQFRLSFKKGRGTLRVGSFEVVWRADGEVSVPSAPTADSVTDDSFVAVWTVDERVDYFVAECLQERMTPWLGDVKWTETFASSVNTTKSSKRLTAETFDGYTDMQGWRGDFVYAPAESQGVIQVNKATESIGWLVSPPLPPFASVELVVRARAMAEQADRVMPVFLVRNGVTNEINSFELTTSFADCHCPMPDILAGDRLVFKSFSAGKKRRVLIDAVSLVEGFIPGHPETNHVFESEMVEYSEFPVLKVDGLESGGDYLFSVRAVSGGVVSEPSDVCKVRTLGAQDSEEPEDWMGVAASNVTDASFQLDWPSVSGAVGYRVSVWTNVVEGASSGNVIWMETFSKAMAASSTSPSAILDSGRFDEDYADNPGWTVVSNVYPSVDSGAVRIGNTSKSGELMMPFGSFSGDTLRVRARRQTSGEGAVFSVWKRSGETLTAIGDAHEIGEQSTECIWTLPEMGAADRIVFRSATGKKSSRTILEDVEVLDGFSEGIPIPDYAVNAVVTDRNSYSIQNLQSAVWMFAVEAIDGSGRTVSAATNSVDLANPPPRPVLDSVPVSRIPRKGGLCVWQEDFCAFTNVFSSRNTADWVNGVSIPFWQAYLGGEAVAGVSRNKGAGTAKGLYAYWDSTEDPSTYSIGVMTAKDAEDFVFGLAFRNDTAFGVRRIAVGYDGVQFGFRNAAAHELLCECLVTNELVPVSADGDWRICNGLTFRTTKDKYSGLVSGVDLPVVTAISSEVSGGSLPKDSYFMLRWRRTATVYAAAMAIDNVTVSFSVQPRPMTIVVR